jgi:histone H3/H4
MKWKIGDQTILGTDVFQVKNIKDGLVELRKIGGRKIITMLPDEIPYLENGKLVTPEVQSWKSLTIDTKINLSKLLKGNTDLQVSKPFMAFVRENIESLIISLLEEAETLALKQNKRRLEPAHWYWLDIPYPMSNTYVSEQNDYAIQESIKYCAKVKK